MPLWKYVGRLRERFTLRPLAEDQQLMGLGDDAQVVAGKAGHCDPHHQRAFAAQKDIEGGIGVAAPLLGQESPDG